MKKFLVFLALLTSLVFVRAETINVTCHDAAETINIIQNRYSEVPIIVMKNVDTQHVIFYNSMTTTWTHLAIKGDVACILADGKGLKVVLKNNQGI